MTISRIVALLLALAAVAWIGSGVLGRDSPLARTSAPSTIEQKSLFKVGVVPLHVELRARRITLSGRTEADRRATAIARAAGIIVDLKVRRGSVVKTGDVIAVLSDEAREAMVDQAAARLEQRRLE